MIPKIFMTKMKTTNKILIVDLEATCWKIDGDYQKHHSEIIEIGICVFERNTGNIYDNEGILVKTVNSEVSNFCTELTTITADMLEDEGISLADACDILYSKYKSHEYTWASYGMYDLRFLKEQCKKLDIPYPMSEDHFNIKTLAKDTFNFKRPLGMKGTLKQLNIQLEGTHHRGKDDARNCAKILDKIFNQ